MDDYIPAAPNEITLTPATESALTLDSTSGEDKPKKKKRKRRKSVVIILYFSTGSVVLILFYRIYMVCLSNCKYESGKAAGSKLHSIFC